MLCLYVKVSFYLLCYAEGKHTTVSSLEMTNQYGAQDQHSDTGVLFPANLVEIYMAYVRKAFYSSWVGIYWE